MRDLLKFLMCGSVDDGKSTLIGHILYDSKLIFADQARALELDSKVGSRGGEIDYSLLLDGLSAEREQGITIDVAYRYFTTEERSFIVADAPGHEEYTRNMAVGASFADLAVILVDASHGVLVQTRRHARICALMGIRTFIFAVNKMDLVGFDEATFDALELQIDDLAHMLGLDHVTVIPVSATEGDNVTKTSPRMPWYTGKALLPFLETVDVSTGKRERGFYMPVQRVSRPDSSFRGYQGQIEAGKVAVGDAVKVLPSGERAHVQSLLVAGKAFDQAVIGRPVTIQLDRDVDVSRGCVIESDSNISCTTGVTATLLWMDDEPLVAGRDFFVKIGCREVAGVVTAILYAIDINSGKRSRDERVEKNGIAVVHLAFADKVVADEFKNHRTLGEIILIDRVSNATSACAVVERLDEATSSQAGMSSEHLRMVLKGRSGIAFEFLLGDKEDQFRLQEVEKVERALVASGFDAYLYAPDASSHVNEVVDHLMRAGITVLLAIPPELAKTVSLRANKLIYRGWQSFCGHAPDEVAAYIRTMTSNIPDAGQGGAYI